MRKYIATILVLTIGLFQASAADTTRSEPKELKSNPKTQEQLILVAHSLAKPRKSYQEWLQIEKEFSKLLEAAGQDKKNILTELLYITTYERERHWEGGPPDLMSLLAYCNFTKEEVVAVVKPLLDTKDDQLLKGSVQILYNTVNGTWENYHRSILSDIEKAKKGDEKLLQK
jgi:hypothetical protein